MMLQGAEFLDNSPEAFVAWEALEPTICKVRRGVFRREDFTRAYNIMLRFTNKPVFIIRSKTEIPDLVELRVTLNEMRPLIPLGAQIYIEVMNEPNHSDTRFGLGNTLEEQIAKYRRLLYGAAVGLAASHPGVMRVAPGLMPEPDMEPWLAPERALYDYDGIHVYGLDMLPHRYFAPPLVTEIGSKSVNRRELVVSWMDWLSERWPIEGYIHFAVPTWMGPDGIYTMNAGDAKAYAVWLKNFEGGQLPMPEDRIKAQLANMWRRQGANPNTVTDPFFVYALEQAKTSGRAIIPQHSPDGNYLDYSDPEVIICYTIPPLWAQKGSNIINEGLPKLPLA